MKPLRISIFGSSLVSSYWNGAATYYRGIVRALHRLGHTITFYEPDAYDRQKNRDIANPNWAKVVVYSGTDEREPLMWVERAAKDSDVLVKTSGVGVWDELLEAAVSSHAGTKLIVLFWDVDAPATLAKLAAYPTDPLRHLVPRFDHIFTYGGGVPVVRGYQALGARQCTPIYNALDPDVHFPVETNKRFEATLALLANRLPDRERRIDEFFFHAAEALPHQKFLLGGNGWQERERLANVRAIGHVGTALHNAFNSTPLAVLNVARDSMADVGYSPATRIFEAAGAAACIITDAWEGIDHFLAPGREILVAEDGDAVIGHLHGLTPVRAREIGEAARQRVRREHTYSLRARQVELALSENPTRMEAAQ